MKEIKKGLIAAGIGVLIAVIGLVYANCLGTSSNPSPLSAFFAMVFIIGGIIWAIVCLIACHGIYKDNYDRKNDPNYYRKKMDEMNKNKLN